MREAQAERYKTASQYLGGKYSIVNTQLSIPNSQVVTLNIEY
jgi:hypothetical protein